MPRSVRLGNKVWQYSLMKKITGAVLPNNILRLMNPIDRPKGNAGLTADQAMQKGAGRLERDEQRIFYNWLLLHEGRGQLTFGWSRTDKPTTRRLGELDFVVYAAPSLSGARSKMGRTLFLEFKLKGSKLRPEQERQVELLTSLGFLVAVPESAAQAILITKNWMAAL
jgi:hypothetical protein